MQCLPYAGGAPRGSLESSRLFRLLKAMAVHRGCGKLTIEEIKYLSPAMERFVLRLNTVCSVRPSQSIVGALGFDDQDV